MNPEHPLTTRQRRKPSHAALPSAVSQIWNLPHVEHFRVLQAAEQSAKCNSAIQQIRNLRYPAPSRPAKIQAGRLPRSFGRIGQALLCLGWCALLVARPGASHAAGASAAGLFARTNLVAWCIVPFDAKKRGPEERAAMLEKLGFKLFAYDYRAEHIPTFDAEMEALKRHNVRLLAWWFPGALNDEAKLILNVLKRHGIREAQLWVSGGGEPTKTPEEQRARVAAEAARLKPIAEAAAMMGCSVALYNHGAWFGEPENQVEIIAQLRSQGATNVGIVYNLHHGHDHLDRFAALLRKTKPHLLALNLNGMVRDGDKLGKKILPLGQGDLDLRLLKIIRNSGWRGPIGILNHTEEDAETRLQENLRGLDRLVEQLTAPSQDSAHTGK